MLTKPSDLSRICGPSHVPALSNAYDAVLLELTGRALGGVPDRETKLLLVTELLRAGRRSGFDPDRMTQAARAAFGLAPPARKRSLSDIAMRMLTWVIRRTPEPSYFVGGPDAGRFFRR